MCTTWGEQLRWFPQKRISDVLANKSKWNSHQGFVLREFSILRRGIRKRGVTKSGITDPLSTGLELPTILVVLVYNKVCGKVDNDHVLGFQRIATFYRVVGVISFQWDK